jgi:hypothetical protein
MNCDCPRCRRVATADPKYGFDRAKVPEVDCLMCGKKIGRRRYRLVMVFARFGDMFFAHRVCPK